MRFCKQIMNVYLKLFFVMNYTQTRKADINKCARQDYCSGIVDLPKLKAHAGRFSNCESKKRTQYQVCSRLKDQDCHLVSVALVPPQLNHLMNFSCSFLLCVRKDIIFPKVYVDPLYINISPNMHIIISHEKILFINKTFFSGHPWNKGRILLFRKPVKVMELLLS